MLSGEVFLKIVRAAIKAPSGHNTQPWLFSKTGDGIFIMPDFSRAMIVADSGNRKLYISLDCAAETAMIADRFYGYKAVPQVRDKMISDSGLDGAYPQLLIRLGYSKKMPYSFRRRINSFTDHQPVKAKL